MTLPNLSLPKPGHCHTAVRGTAKIGTAKFVALPNYHVRGTAKFRTAKSLTLPTLALPNPWWCQIRHCQIRGIAKLLSVALPNSELPDPWHCQLWHCQFRCIVKLPSLALPNFSTAKSVKLPNLALLNLWQCKTAVPGTAKV